MVPFPRIPNHLFLVNSMPQGQEQLILVGRSRAGSTVQLPASTASGSSAGSASGAIAS